jgi:hypothetical protein
MSSTTNDGKPDAATLVRTEDADEPVAASPHNTYGSAQAVYGSPLSRYPHEHVEAIGEQDTPPAKANAEVEAA